MSTNETAHSMPDHRSYKLHLAAFRVQQEKSTELAAAIRRAIDALEHDKPRSEVVDDLKEALAHVE